MLPSTLSMMLTLLATCPSLPTDSLELVPETATLAVGGEVDRIVGTRIGQAVVRGLEADLQVGDALGILAECGVDLGDLGEVWLARDAGEGRLLFARSDALANPETLACLATELRARDQGRDPWTTRSTSDCTTLDLRDGSRAWVLGTDALVWARGSMITAIEQPDADAKPSALLDAVDRRAHAWLAAVLDQPSWAIEARSLIAALDLEQQGRAGVWIDFALTADDLASTATLRDRVLGLVAQFADRLDALGIEHRLRERTRVGLVDGALLGTLELDVRELEQIQAQLTGAGSL
jgi:hypothetical protein